MARPSQGWGSAAVEVPQPLTILRQVGERLLHTGQQRLHLVA